MTRSFSIVLAAADFKARDFEDYGLYGSIFVLQL